MFSLPPLSVNMRIFVYFVLTSAARPFPVSQMDGSLGSGTTFAPEDAASTDLVTDEVYGQDGVTGTAITSTSTQPVPITASVRRKWDPVTLKPFDQSVSVPPSSIVYPDSLFKKIGATLSHHVRALIHGHAITALGVPRLAYDAELIMTGPKAGRLPIGEQLATTSSSNDLRGPQRCGSSREVSTQLPRFEQRASVDERLYLPPRTSRLGPRARGSVFVTTGPLPRVGYAKDSVRNAAR